jgi:hypothetical protein
MSPYASSAISDDEFDSFLSFLETPTTTKNVKTPAVSDGGGVSLGSSSDNEFSDFLAYLDGGDVQRPARAAAPRARAESVRIAEPVFGGGDAAVSRKGPVTAKGGEDSLDDFLAYLDGGDVPKPARAAAAAPRERVKSVRIAEPAGRAAAAPAVSRAPSPAAPSSRPIDPRSLPADHFAAESAREVEARSRALRERSESARPVAVAHFSRLAEEEGARRRSSMRDLSDGSMPVATRHFNERANEEKARRQSSMRELSDASMPVATRHFNEVALRKEEARSTRHLSVGSVAPLEPVPIDYFVNLYKEEGGTKASGSTPDVESMPVATSHFTKLAREKSQVKVRTPDVESMPVATSHFTKLAREKSQVKVSMDIESMPLATAHFAKLEAEKTARLATEAQEVDMMPVAIQRFTMAAREEKLRKKASIIDAEEVSISAAQLHFTPGLSQRLLASSE